MSLVAGLIARQAGLNSLVFVAAGMALVNPQILSTNQRHYSLLRDGHAQAKDSQRLS